MDVYQEALSYLESHHAAAASSSLLIVCVYSAVGTGGEALEDVFHEETVSCFLSPLSSESIDFPDTLTSCSREEMLEKRLVVLRGILDSEEVYLRELDALLAPMKALRASAGTSQPVLSSQQVQTVFYQIPELRDVHQSFYSGLKARLGAHTPPESSSGQDVPSCSSSELEMGDLFLKLVNHLGLYGGFIENYEKALGVVRKCTQANPLFRTLAETLYINGAYKARTAYTLEALLYKPLDRITKTTLVLRDLLKTTPVEHKDYAALQEALRLSQSFLSGVNESSQSKREVTLTHGMRRQLMRDGFVVDASDGVRSLRHFFLYTDLLLCTRFKHAGRGKQDQYRFSWYLPLAGLRLRWVADHEQPPDTTVRLLNLRTKMFLLRQQLQQNPKGARGLTWTARNRKKLEQMELLLLTHSPVYRLDLHSPSGKSHTLFFPSLYDLEEWRDNIHKLTRGNIETIPPDLLTLTCACVKLRMTQQPHLHSSVAEDEKSLCGTVSVAIHSASGLQEPACVYVCVEVDGYEFYDKQAQTHSSVRSLNPLWDQELSFQVDGAQKMMVLCVSQSDGEEAVLGKTTVQLESSSLSSRWRRQTLQLGQLEVTLSLKYCPHQLEAPGAPIQQPPVFCVPIEKVAQQEGVLVPHVVRCCVEEVERRGMDEVGIYRISGTATDISSLKAAFNTNLREAVTRLRSAEVNTVSGVLKLYFRELPEPLMPPDLFQSLAKTLDIQDMNSRLVSMLSLLQSCPDVNRNTFLYLIHHLQRVAKRQDVNKMTLMNLATVFGPSLLRPPVAGLEHNGVTVDISQEVVIQVQVVFSYLQSNSLPEAQTSLPYGSDTEEETTHM
ncbi:active breakpoint cluster region-related protein isoform X2 [Xiphophorus couchianus]|uniref:active breakpoint cluster region-related protein isoform X2 n=1 Tax=Xiphophorus couchianus TaxID=32473 RepID=UPI0010163C5A|nr:active breakpoint cluster region-related protein-like isoform X2 [Xiphophorus couchianus]